jgi:hypothetical protein
MSVVQAAMCFGLFVWECVLERSFHLAKGRSSRGTDRNGLPLSGPVLVSREDRVICSCQSRPAADILARSCGRDGSNPTMTADGLLDDHKTIGWRLLQRRRDQLSAGHHLCEPHGIRHSARASSFLMPGAVRTTR